jgi:hypothetical protein
MNVIRVAALVPLELAKLNGATVPDFAHASAGVTAFLVLISIVSFVALRLKRDCGRVDVISGGDSVGEDRSRPDTITAREKAFDNSSHSWSSTAGKINVAYAGTCLAIALLSLIMIDHRARLLANVAPSDGRTNWPAKFEGRTLTPQAMSREQNKFKAFSGKIAKFTDGKNEILFREVRTATRQLHSSSDCFRGSGFSIEPMPMFMDNEGDVWSRFQATRGEQRLEVREIVSDLQGQSWSDVSSWYWAAVLGKTKGPWLATTVATGIGMSNISQINESEAHISFDSGR